MLKRLIRAVRSWWSKPKLCDDLIRFADGELPKSRAEAFRVHLRTCERCDNELLSVMQLQARLSEFGEPSYAFDDPGIDVDLSEDGETMSNAKYGWIVTVDHLTDKLGPVLGFTRSVNNVGRVGPANIALETEERLKAGEGARWRAKDDDGELYYEGLFIGHEPQEQSFAPLEDFATPYAGATTIEYFNAETNCWNAL